MTPRAKDGSGQPQEVVDLPRVRDVAAPADMRTAASRSKRRRTEPLANAWAALAATTIIASTATWTSAESLALSYLVFLLSGATFGRPSRWSAMLPLTRTLVRVGHPAVAVLVLWTLLHALPLAQIPLADLAAAGVAAALVAFSSRRFTTVDVTRVAVVGDPRSAQQLGLKLREAEIVQYSVVGAVLSDEDLAAAPHAPSRALGALSTLDALIADHEIDLLLIDGHATLVDVFDRLADSCLHLPVRVCELTQFYEDTFGHVPVSEIDSAWFRYIMHPRFRSADSVGKRTLDLVVALAALLVFLPMMLVCALLIKLYDGGPVLFSQRRIGSQGAAFTLLKLRTMQVSVAAAQWSSVEDPRVTPIGRVLRRTHIDELPQLLNVLRGDMTVVGPRPEQPEFVERLERTLPHYNRRHLIKPGVTGWAQVRCGYAGSDAGSALKLCHDLFYLKHRSLGLDLAILAETLRTLVADRQFPLQIPGERGPGGVEDVSLFPACVD
jgi:exopolysaccharide biosynthesis polyprenyl glycosylphosphotransferase